MKVIAKPIQMVAWFDEKGTVHPVRFKIEMEDEETKVIKIDRIVKRDMEKLAGNPMLVFTCRSLIDGVEKVFEIKYEIGTMRWMLFKI